MSGETVGRSTPAFTLPQWACYAGTLVLFVVTVLGAVVTADQFAASGATLPNPESAGNLLYLVGAVTVGTLVFLAIAKFDLGTEFVQIGIVLLVGYETFFVLRALGALTTVPAAVAGVIAAVVFYVHPAWYVVNAVAVLFGIAAAGIFGASLVPGLVVALLIVAAVYDLIAVHGTGHMETLAESVSDVRVPALFVIPTDPTAGVNAVLGDDEDAVGGAALGVGDAVFPGLLAVSAQQFLDAPAVVAGIGLPALAVTLGALAGVVGTYLVLVRTGEAQPALPLANAGALIAFFAAVLVVGIDPLTALGL